MTYYERNKEQCKARTKKYYQANRLELRRKAKAYYAANPGIRSKTERKRLLKRKYGITLGDYERMYAEQEGKCYICNTPSKLTVDHCHKTLRVRHLLCQLCNALIGMSREDVSILQKAISYIQEGTIVNQEG